MSSEDSSHGDQQSHDIDVEQLADDFIDFTHTVEEDFRQRQNELQRQMRREAFVIGILIGVIVGLWVGVFLL